MKAWRSLLFTPGDAPERLAHAPKRGADAVILDLEDAVAPGAKAQARAAAAGHVAALSAAGASVVVRINGGWADAVADVQALAGAPIAAVMVPKVSSAWRMRAVVDMVAEMMSLPGVIALVESAEGVANAAEIAATPGVTAMAFGSEDFASDLGAPPTPEALDLPCRQLALAAASRGLPCFGLPAALANFTDLDVFEQAARRGRAFGMSGALCVHPSQVAVANRAFGSTAAERDRAQGIVSAWENRPDGDGVLSLDGRMIDAPVVAQARRVLARPPAAED